MRERRLKSLEEFIATKNALICLYYGESNQGKSAFVRDFLLEKRNVYQVCEICASHDQPNMVIEHLSSILNLLLNKSDLEDFGKYKNHVDNLNFIILDIRRLFYQGSLKKKIVFLIDNAETIFSLHHCLGSDSWQQHVMEQWEVFLQKLTELNCEEFDVRIVLIANKDILELTRLRPYLVRVEHSKEKISDESRKVVIRLHEIQEASDKGEKINCDDGDKDRLVKSGNAEVVLRLTPDIKEFMAKKKNELIENIKNIASMKEQEITTDDNLEFIRGTYEFFHFIQVLEKMSSEERYKKVVPDCYDCLCEILCTPKTESHCSDIGDTLRQYGYGKLLLSMICGCQQYVKKSPNNKNNRMRLKILEGNVLYYENDYVKALKCYSAVTSNTKMGFLAKYEIVRTLHQLNEQRWWDVLSEQEIISLQEILEKLNKKYNGDSNQEKFFLLYNNKFDDSQKAALLLPLMKKMISQMKEKSDLKNIISQERIDAAKTIYLKSENKLEEIKSVCEDFQLFKDYKNSYWRDYIFFHQIDLFCNLFEKQQEEIFGWCKKIRNNQSNQEKLWESLLKKVKILIEKTEKDSQAGLGDKIWRDAKYGDLYSRISLIKWKKEAELDKAELPQVIKKAEESAAKYRVLGHNQKAERVLNQISQLMQVQATL